LLCTSQTAIDDLQEAQIDQLALHTFADQEAEPQATALAAMIDEHEDGGHYEWADGDAFESELKHKVKDYFRKEAGSRSVLRIVECLLASEFSQFASLPVRVHRSVRLCERKSRSLTATRLL